MLLDVLEISRAEQDVDDRAMESVDLAVLVARVSETTCGDRPVVVKQPPPVYADRRRLVRVVANLLDNAKRRGGGVAEVTVTERNGMARLEVDANGPGVPVERRKLRRLFDALLLRPTKDPYRLQRWSLWCRRHQARARASHYRRRDQTP